jgi:precorrin-2 dehydrogenase/sirohydrochlorin ferrochelatase
VLVVGAVGEIAGKVPRLVAAGARVRVVTEGEVDALIQLEVDAGRVELARRPFAWSDLDGAWLVYVGLGHEALDAELFAWATRERRLLNTVDRPATCTFISPAVVDLPELQLSVSTHGASPGTARRIREDLEATFRDPRFAAYVAALRRLRDAVPRAERAARLARALAGFEVRASLVFPSWLTRGEEP